MISGRNNRLYLVILEHRVVSVYSALQKTQCSSTGLGLLKNSACKDSRTEYIKSVYLRCLHCKHPEWIKPAKDYMLRVYFCF